MQVNGCFDAGMAYVSLSRVRTLGGLRFQRHCAASLECEGCPGCCCSLTPQSVSGVPWMACHLVDCLRIPRAALRRFQTALTCSHRPSQRIVPSACMQVRAHSDVKTFYALSLELSAAASAMAERLADERSASAHHGASAACAAHVEVDAARASFAEAAQQLRSLGPCAIAELAATLAQRIDVPQPLRVQAHALHAKALALSPGTIGEPPTGRGRRGVGIEGWWTVPPLPDTKANRAVG